MNYEKITIELEEGRFRDCIIADYAYNDVEVHYAVVVIDHNPSGVSLANAKPEIFDFDNYEATKTFIKRLSK